MFGVIVEIEMKVQGNVHLWMEMIDCSIDEFPLLYKNLLNQKDVNIKLGRIDTVSGNKCQLFVFREQMEPGIKTVSKLPLEPREMSTESRFLYKWILPTTKGLRSVLEETLGRALDWSDETERNSLIYESCEPLARLYSPFHKFNDSFVLQEFFVPVDFFTPWIQEAKSTLTKYGSGKYGNVTLLNLTVRFVKEDNTTFLAYSRAKAGSFAFVLYYRIKRSPEADAILQDIHSTLTDISTTLGIKTHLGKMLFEMNLILYYYKYLPKF